MDLPLPARVALSFLIGAIPFAVVAMWGTGIDITKVGSRNPGFNNVLRVASKWRALVALVGDVSKGYVALLLFSRIGESAWPLGLAAILGHCFTPFLRFRGGKGVATSAGVLFYLEPILTLAFPAVYFPIRLYGRKKGWSQKGAIASLLALFVVTVLVVGRRGLEPGIFALVLLLLVTLRHTSNLREIFQASGA